MHRLFSGGRCWIRQCQLPFPRDDRYPAYPRLKAHLGASLPNIAALEGAGGSRLANPTLAAAFVSTKDSRNLSLESVLRWFGIPSALAAERATLCWPIPVPDLCLNCHSCGHALPLMPGDMIGRRDTCTGCGADLHACVHCRHFDPSRSSQCCEPQAEWVSDKEKSNFCDYFEVRTAVNLTSQGRSSRRIGARAAFHNLFKD